MIYIQAIYISIPSPIYSIIWLSFLWIWSPSSSSFLNMCVIGHHASNNLPRCPTTISISIPISMFSLLPNVQAILHHDNTSQSPSSSPSRCILSFPSFLLFPIFSPRNILLQENSRSRSCYLPRSTFVTHILHIHCRAYLCTTPSRTRVEACYAVKVGEELRVAAFEVFDEASFAHDGLAGLAGLDLLEFC